MSQSVKISEKQRQTQHFLRLSKVAAHVYCEMQPNKPNIYSLMSVCVDLCCSLRSCGCTVAISTMFYKTDGFTAEMTI